MLKAPTPNAAAIQSTAKAAATPGSAAAGTRTQGDKSQGSLPMAALGQVPQPATMKAATPAAALRSTGQHDHLLVSVSSVRAVQHVPVLFIRSWHTA